MKLTEALENLRKPVPQTLMCQKKIKGKTIQYIAWFDYCQLLDDRIDLWSWEIVNLVVGKDRLYLTGKLTIIGEDRSLSMMATGTESLECSNYGDPSSNAESMSMRRCCAKMGLTREMWRKEEKYVYRNNSSSSYHRIPNKTPPIVNKKTSDVGKEITKDEWLKINQK